MEQGKVYLLFILFNLKYIVILTYYLEVSFFFSCKEVNSSADLWAESGSYSIQRLWVAVLLGLWMMIEIYFFTTLFLTLFIIG